VPFRLTPEEVVEPVIVIYEPTGGAQVLGEVYKLPLVEVAALKVTVSVPAELVAIPVVPTVRVTGP
jgi:hypothetical protein